VDESIKPNGDIQQSQEPVDVYSTQKDVPRRIDGNDKNTANFKRQKDTKVAVNFANRFADQAMMSS
jgi:hypothetical protein